MNMIEFLKNNFWHVFPILAAGVFAILIVIDRVKALFYTYPLKAPEAFFERITGMLASGRAGDAIALCNTMPAKPVAKVVKTALLRAHLPDDLLAHGMEMTLSEAHTAIQKRTSFLATVANVATLLGLFGTIAGLISSFEAVGHADAQQKSALLADGISTAMNATMLGLGVAIPCMILFSLLVNQANRLVSDTEHAAVRAVDIVKLRMYQLETPNEQMATAVADAAKRVA